MLSYTRLARLRASSRDVWRMGPGAAPAGGARNPALGRRRDPTGGHYDPSARSSLDWDCAKALVPGSADPVLSCGLTPATSAAMERRGARTLRQGARASPSADCWMRHAALHPLGLWPGAKESPGARRENDGLPGADKEHGRSRMPAAPIRRSPQRSGTRPRKGKVTNAHVRLKAMIRQDLRRGIG
jgi:hypothetical protein